jgi:hypothetical protein
VNIDDVTKSGHGHLTAFEFVVASISPESADNDSKCGNADTLLSNPGDDHWVGDWNDPAIPPGLIHDDGPSDSSSRGPSPEYPEPTTRQASRRERLGITSISTMTTCFGRRLAHLCCLCYLRYLVGQTTRTKMTCGRKHSHHIRLLIPGQLHRSPDYRRSARGPLDVLEWRL